MPVSGLLLTLSTEEHVAAEVVRRLQSRREILLGELQQQWLPVAVDGCDERHSREVHDWIVKLPGVVFVDVVSVHFEDGEQTSSPHALTDCKAA